MKKAFTLIELIFVIVIIGLLAAVAVPKFVNLKQNAVASNVLAVITDLNGSGGASAYLNAKELNGYSDVNITDLYKFNGKDWDISSNNDKATYRNGKSDFNASFTYDDDNGEVNVTIFCDTSENLGKAAQNYLKKHGYDCSSSGTTYTIKLDTQE